MTLRGLIEWLSKADESALGECECPELRELERMKLVTIRPVPGKPKEYSRVSLTDAGWHTLRVTDRSPQ